MLLFLDFDGVLHPFPRLPDRLATESEPLVLLSEVQALDDAAQFAKVSKSSAQCLWTPLVAGLIGTRSETALPGPRDAAVGYRKSRAGARRDGRQALLAADVRAIDS